MEFIPTFPFAMDQTYEIIENGQDYLRFTPKRSVDVVRSKTKDFITIHPQVDTVPENLLKMYITFARPVSAAQNVLDHITVFDSDTKEVRDIFLELENELWNTDRTEVTLWLDPGRIKKDLIPNKERGNPLIKRRTYTIVVGGTLKYKNGDRIGESRTEFVVGHRDEVKPDIQRWDLTLPAKDTKESLGFDFHESLDAKLFEETVRILNAKGELIPGNFLKGKKAKSYLFIPEQRWMSGIYRIEVESRLEDLAGNNLNRLFDVDLENRGEVRTSEFKTREFRVN
jgi:hypothetical protein